MVDFLIFCMATVGLTAILVDGKVFAPFRERLENRVRVQEERQQATIARSGKKRRTWSGFLLDILTCYQCCGFWSGLFCGVFLTLCHFFAISDWFSMFDKWVATWYQLDKIHFASSLRVHIRELTYLSIMAAALFWLMCGLAGSFLATVYLMIVELVYTKTMLYRRTNLEPPLEDDTHEEP